MTVSDVYRCCSNIDPDAVFHFHTDSSYYREEGGTVYKHFNDIPYNLLRVEVQAFFIADDGFTVHVLT